LLKRESRILGLSGARIKDKLMIVGVVFRGSLWLDGVVTSTIDIANRNFNSEISKTIESTKQFSQLHAMILSRRLAPYKRISIVELSTRVKRPVIQPSSHIKKRGSNKSASVAKKLDLVVNGRHIVVSAVGIAREDAEQLYRIACSPSCKMPEAVRVADLIAEQLRHEPLDS
jgi:endonuclease V-like protein UPF0215 family